MPVAELPVGSASANVTTFAAGHAGWSSIPAGASTEIPPVFNASQAYYWTHIWQQGEREAAAELRQGQSRIFANGADAVRWLLSTDED